MKLNEKWQAWILDNIESGVSRQDLFIEVLKGGFSLKEAKAYLGMPMISAELSKKINALDLSEIEAKQSKPVSLLDEVDLGTRH